MGQKYVWYACYGANMKKDIFMEFYQGKDMGEEPLPLDDQPVTIDHKLFFANQSEKWDNGGIAYLHADSNPNAETFGRMYLIPEEDFIEIFRQANGVDPEELITIPERFKRDTAVLFPDAEFGRLLSLGSRDGYPIYTFTCVMLPIEEEFNLPSKAYLDTLMEGIRETYNMDEDDILHYLSRCKSALEKDTLTVGKRILKVALPKGFTVTERPENNECILRNMEENLMIHITSKKIPLMSRGSKVSIVIQETQTMFQKNLPTFQDLDDLDLYIPNEDCAAFTFKHMINDILHTTDYLLVKNGKYYISFVYTGQTETFEDKYDAYTDFLETVEIIHE